MEKLWKVIIWDYWNYENVDEFGLFKTYQEAECLVNALKEMNYLENVYPEDDVDITITSEPVADNVDDLIARLNEKCDEAIKEHEKFEVEQKASMQTAIKILERVRELFAPLDLANNLTKEWFREHAKEIHEVVVDNGLSVHLFDRVYDYNSDGTIEKWDGHERISYYPIRVFIDEYRGFRYNYENYDIDDDIEKLRNEIGKGEN